MEVKLVLRKAIATCLLTVRDAEAEPNSVFDVVGIIWVLDICKHVLLAVKVLPLKFQIVAIGLFPKRQPAAQLKSDAPCVFVLRCQPDDTPLKCVVSRPEAGFRDEK